MFSLSGQLLTPTGLRPGRLTFDTHLHSLEPQSGVPPRYILPGFIDVHVHGGGGGDTMDGLEGVRTLARFHAQHGTTSLLPTTLTHRWEEVMAALEGVQAARAQGVTGGADVLGAHLEGPFISPQRLGAQPPFTLLPDPERLAEVLALDVVRVVTVAPELEGMAQAARTLAQAGVRVSLGHTAGTYQAALEVLEAVKQMDGTCGATHLYNAMGGLSGREPGPLGAVLAHPEVYAELILDLHHVHPGAFRVALEAKPHTLMLVTDAMRAAGTPEGHSELGGQRVRVQGGRATLEDGTLAGSLLTLDAALRHAVQCGVSLERASQLLSGVPARYLGLSDRGTLERGLRADLVVLSAALEVEEVWVGGVRVR